MDGYAKIARLMANHHEMATFRGFEAIGFQNLLYLQAELVYLQDELQELVKADKESGHPIKSVYEKDWRQLRQSQADGSEQWQKVLEIRAKLREYCKQIMSKAWSFCPWGGVLLSANGYILTNAAMSS
jgi:hypothetical protein